MRLALKAALVFATLILAANSANAWYCTAESKNGAVGTGFHFFEDLSRKMALSDCRQHSKGHICRITSCW